MADNVLAYRYSANITYTDDQGSETIDSMFIRYIVVESLYASKTIPVIYLSISLLPELYTRILNNEKNAKFYLELRCYNILSEMYIEESFIKEEFGYMLPSNDPTYRDEIASNSKAPDDNYLIITLALISNKLMNASRSEKDANDSILMSGVFGKIDTDTLIGKVVSGFDKYNIKTVIKAPDHNHQFNELIIPPMNNRKQIIDYIFDKAPFYNTSFIFFIDFNTAYLLDWYIDMDAEEDNHVIFEVNDITNPQSFQEGMTIENGAYHINILPSNIQINTNKTQDKVANNLITIGEDGKLDIVKLNVNNSEYSDPKYTFIRGANAILYKNIAEANIVQVIISKDNLNSSLFTPDKKYSIMNFSSLPEYNGNYFLTQKREIIRNNMGVLRGSIEFVLTKTSKSKNIETTKVDESKDILTTEENTKTNTKRVKISATNNNPVVTGSAKRGFKEEKSNKIDWEARTAIRSDVKQASKKSAGATKFILAKDKQTLSKTINVER